MSAKRPAITWKRTTEGPREPGNDVFVPLSLPFSDPLREQDFEPS